MALTAFVSFIRRLGWSFFCPFRAFCSVRGHWGGEPCGVYSVTVVFYWALGLVICGTFQRLYYL